ncbi:TolC family protein [Arachidicoccus terrestris]|uniref:TolC family protein n=1 Tax=Arachidicoccus terrestris TaxID=2875539 RepID=UPI001CC34CA2|nr:TolC family protein [Arachidicoccus terrestris]UAY54765.1 TolC family protein [Arachidicoccus terrestris]
MVKTKFFLWIFFMAFAISSFSQERAGQLSLEACFSLAKAHYPILQQDSGLQRQLFLSLKNLQSQRLPDFSLTVSGSYQSDVTQLPITIPGIEIPTIGKDQYKALLDVRQLIYDGGRIKKSQELQQTQTALLQQEQAITFHQLKSQLTLWYEHLLTIQATIQALRIKEADLTKQLQKTKVAIENGVSLPTRAEELQVALLQTGQQVTDQQAIYHAEMQVLSLVTGKTFQDSTQLVIPAIDNAPVEQQIERPELQGYLLRHKLLTQQSSLLDAKNVPKIQLFAQSGYGRPALNMLKNDFDWFYIAGVRLNWSLWDWHRKKRTQESLEIDSHRVTLQKDNFLLNTQLELNRQIARIESLESRVYTDEKIVELQMKISKTAAVQLQQGTLTPTEYLIQLNKAVAAQIAKQTHHIELQFAKYNYQLLKSN